MCVETGRFQVRNGDEGGHHSLRKKTRMHFSFLREFRDAKELEGKKRILYKIQGNWKIILLGYPRVYQFIVALMAKAIGLTLLLTLFVIFQMTNAHAIPKCQPQLGKCKEDTDCCIGHCILKGTAGLCQPL
ncbi:uncharacterized protein VTP21DRAFT_11222 [Calcarisporiella thermophila]|uniref:uncharacterized protein n=1 Tax=Calcarisporiella thermophila TaxID=911321 RepID=UPI00374397A5